mgnify:CR=1 FL=1
MSETIEKVKKPVKRAKHIPNSHKPNVDEIHVESCVMIVDGKEYRIGLKEDEFVPLDRYMNLHNRHMFGLLFWMKTGRLPQRYWFYIPAIKTFFIQNRPYPSDEFLPKRLLNPKPKIIRKKRKPKTE